MCLYPLVLERVPKSVKFTLIAVYDAKHLLAQDRVVNAVGDINIAKMPVLAKPDRNIINSGKPVERNGKEILTGISRLLQSPWYMW